jgi:phosphoribosylglycinamide formyltransferase-1
MLKVGVLASGRGSNFEALAKAFQSGKIKGEIKVLIVDKRNAGAIERAKKYGINWIFVDAKSFPTREDYDSKIVSILKHLEVDLVCLAGYMRIVSPVFVNAFKNRIMNIHPAILPAFPGLNAQKKAVEYGVKVSGATVHFVDEGVDTGPVIIQAVVPVSPEDTEKTLSEKILKFEHRIYPQAVKWFAEGRIKVNGRKVIVEGADYNSLPVVPSLEDF